MLSARVIISLNLQSRCHRHPCRCPCQLLPRLAAHCHCVHTVHGHPACQTRPNRRRNRAALQTAPMLAILQLRLQPLQPASGCQRLLHCRPRMNSPSQAVVASIPQESRMHSRAMANCTCLSPSARRSSHGAHCRCRHQIRGLCSRTLSSRTSSGSTSSSNRSNSSSGGSAPAGTKGTNSSSPSSRRQCSTCGQRWRSSESSLHTCRHHRPAISGDTGKFACRASPGNHIVTISRSEIKREGFSLCLMAVLLHQVSGHLWQE